MRSTTRLATLAAALSIFAAAPAGAWATNRYVGVGGSTTDPSCTDPTQPCDLMSVLKTVAQDGDDVTVEPGTYSGGQDIALNRALTIHGEAGIPPDKSWPVIWGQHQGYIYLELRDFKSGARQNPVMAPIVANLSRCMTNTQPNAVEA